MKTITYKLSVEQNPSNEDKTVLGNALYHSDSAKVGSMNFRVFAAFLRDPNGQICGGGVGTTMWNWVYLNWVWLPEDLRGKGWGRKIILSIEEEAVNMDCGFAYINTYDFQAPGFYLKLGYEIFGELDDFPEGHKSYFMKKRLR